MRLLSETFWLLVLGAVALFAFFAALGAFSVTEAVGVTDSALVRDRERRGF